MFQDTENPNLNEEDMALVRNYCLYHKLSRPDTNLAIGLKWFLGLELLTVALTFGVNFLLGKFGFSISLYLLYSLASFIVFVVSLKKMSIIAIEMYQHYASDEVRRRCTLIPSCSEYALLALSKYNVVKGLCKIIIRLANKCNGIYKIDYP